MANVKTYYYKLPNSLSKKAALALLKKKSKGRDFRSWTYNPYTGRATLT